MGPLDSEFTKAHFWEKCRILSYISNVTKISQIWIMSYELFPKYETSRKRIEKTSFRPKPWTQPILNPILISKPIWKLNFTDNLNHWIMTHCLILVVGWDLVTLTIYKGFFHIQKPHKLEILDPLISNLSLSRNPNF